MSAAKSPAGRPLRCQVSSNNSRCSAVSAGFGVGAGSFLTSRLPFVRPNILGCRNWFSSRSPSIDSSGTIYGTTGGGGTSVLCFWNGNLPGCGTIFKLDSSGNESVLYSFDGRTQPLVPFSGVIFDSEGNLYGTTTEGGKIDNGAIFELTP